MINLQRTQIQQQTLSNLISAGVLRQNEAESYNEKLSAMQEYDLLTALVLSHQLREDCSFPGSCVHYFTGEISLN